MASAGRILIMPKGAYSASATYEMLDMVSHNGTTWVAKKTVKGIEPSTANSEQWHSMFDLDIANNLTTAEEGKVLDARQGKVLKDTKQERRTESVTIGANSSYTLTMDYGESCILAAYTDVSYYNAVYVCCGSNENLYSIVKLAEILHDNSLEVKIADIDGKNLNQITFKNNTNSDKTLTLIKLPFFEQI